MLEILTYETISTSSVTFTMQKYETELIVQVSERDRGLLLSH